MPNLQRNGNGARGLNARHGYLWLSIPRQCAVSARYCWHQTGFNNRSMASGKVHFEVFFKKHPKGEWVLVEALNERSDAIALADKLVAKAPRGSARVARETWIEASGTFATVTIHEVGAERFAVPKEKTGEAKLPCVTPDDLAGPAARDTVRRVLAPWLERQEVCPLELLYRPDMIEALDACESDLQHAIQKVAIARSQNSDASVHAYVRLLTELVEKGIEKSRKEAKRKTQDPKNASFRELTEKIYSEGSAETRLRRAIAERLTNAPGMARKAEMLLDFHDDLPDEPEAREFAAKEADAFLAEMLSFDRALHQIIGQSRDLGSHVERLTSVFAGEQTHPSMFRAPDNARRLAAKFKARELPGSKGEIARRVLDALRQPKRFKPDNVLEEIALARSLAQRLIAASGDHLNPQALVEAFTVRSARLLSPESVEEALKEATTPAEEVSRLLSMEDNLVGEQNKVKLASYVRARLTAQKSVSWFAKGPGQPFERLAQLSALQKRALKGSFPESAKAEMSEAFDALGMMIIHDNQLFERITGSNLPALDRATGLLRLAAQDILPLGRCQQDAQARAMRLLSSEMGRSEAREEQGPAKLQELQGLLARIQPAEPAKVAAEPEAGQEPETDMSASP